MPIKKSILYLERQNIPLRGYRYDRPLLVDDVNSKCHIEYYFRDFLRPWVEAGDKTLEKYLKTTY